MMPTNSTRPISALSPGLAKNACTICLLSTTITSAQSTRNTSIRTRKIRGEDSLASSISIVEREEGAAAGIAVSSMGTSFFRQQYGTAVPGKKPDAGGDTARTGNFAVKPRVGLYRI